jgi:hypothetical protein
MTKRIAFILIVVAFWTSAQAAQYMIQVIPASAEALPMTAFELAYSSTEGGAKTSILVGEAGQTNLPASIEDAAYFYVRPMWAGVTGSEGAWSSSLYTGTVSTAPVLLSVAVNAAGTSVTTTWSESVVVNSGAPSLLDAGGNTITLGSPIGSGASRSWTPSRTILQTDVLTLSYIQPGNGIEDTGGEDWASVSGFAVTGNASTQGGVLTVTGITGDLIYVSRLTKTYDMSIVSSRAAACKVGPNSAALDTDGVAMATSDNLTHTSTVSTFPGRSHRYCVVCTDNASSVKSVPQCQYIFSRY